MNPKNPDQVGLMVKRSHPRVLGLVGGNPFLRTYKGILRLKDHDGGEFLHKAGYFSVGQVAALVLVIPTLHFSCKIPLSDAPQKYK